MIPKDEKYRLKPAEKSPVEEAAKNWLDTLTIIASYEAAFIARAKWQRDQEVNALRERLQDAKATKARRKEIGKS